MIETIVAIFGNEKQYAKFKKFSTNQYVYIERCVSNVKLIQEMKLNMDAYRFIGYTDKKW